MPQDKFKMVVKTFAGLEDILAEEIKEIGGKNIKILKRAIMFDGSKEQLYLANLCLRTALRVLKPVSTFSVSSPEELYKKAKLIRWDRYLRNDQTLAIDSSVSSEYFNHANYVALKVKDAIVDQFRESTGKRPSVDIDQPTLRINVHISNKDCTISLDSSGQSLHKRGYRESQTEAPLNEVLAAGMIMLTGWHGEKDFYDPMCGSGTLLMEAASIASNTPPGALCVFGFMKWNDFDNELWNQVTDRAYENFKKPSCKIYGSDISQRAIHITRKNTIKAQLDNIIELETKAFEQLLPHDTTGILVMNPPYGERIEEKDLNLLYEKIGDKLKKDFNGFEAWLFSGNKDALKHVGLKPSKKITLLNGTIECSFRKFEMYDGSRRTD